MPNLPRVYHANDQGYTSLANVWDVLAFAIVASALFALAWGARQMAVPYQLGHPLPITLDPHLLPYYAGRTVLRMFIALLLSLLATFTIGTLAAKVKSAEKILLPLIDVLQSVPVLGFQSISVGAFIALFPDTLLGPECAAIFAIFTAQVWNMILSFYQSLISLPKEMREASRILQLSGWQIFWRIEVPFALPGLLWNTMMSLSAGWFFVSAAEAISVTEQTILLPGIGSYIEQAVVHAQPTAIGYALGTMLVVILGYDQLVFRPLIHWADTFKQTAATDDDHPQNAWIIRFFQRTRLFKKTGDGLRRLFDLWVNWRFFNPVRPPHFTPIKSRHWPLVLPWLSVFIGVGWLLHRHLPNFKANLQVSDIDHALQLGAITTLRIAVLILLCTLIWVPVGVWIGLRPSVAKWVQPIIQFLAAFPANLLFPVAVVLIIKHHLNVEIWSSPLIILGTQWYILFNVIAGTQAMPAQLSQAAKTLHLRGLLWWKTLILPGIMPALVTGMMTAAGGAWNATILGEALRWGQIELNATGLGAYITHHATRGNFAELALGLIVMCGYVLVLNRVIWQPLYRLATRHGAVGET